MSQGLSSFEAVKKEQFVIDHILWDIEPKDLMAPRRTVTAEGITKRDQIKGYIFYIDVTNITPQLFLLRHTAGDYAETLCVVEDIPVEFLKEAVKENSAKEYFKMYPINGKVREWLMKELVAG